MGFGNRETGEGLTNPDDCLDVTDEGNFARFYAGRWCQYYATPEELRRSYEQQGGDMKYPKLRLQGYVRSVVDVSIEFEELVNVKDFGAKRFINPRMVGEFGEQGYSLNHDYDWVIGEDSFGVLCLIPLRKDKG